MPDSSEYCNLLWEMLDIYNKSNGKQPHQQRNLSHSLFQSVTDEIETEEFLYQLSHFIFITAVFKTMPFGVSTSKYNWLIIL